jgi:hypothetical protein
MSLKSPPNTLGIFLEWFVKRRKANNLIWIYQNWHCKILLQQGEFVKTKSICLFYANYYCFLFSVVASLNVIHHSFSYLLQCCMPLIFKGTKTTTTTRSIVMHKSENTHIYTHLHFLFSQ